MQHPTLLVSVVIIKLFDYDDGRNNTLCNPTLQVSPARGTQHCYDNRWIPSSASEVTVAPSNPNITIFAGMSAYSNLFRFQNDRICEGAIFPFHIENLREN